MSKKSSDSEFGGFFVAVGAIGGFFAGIGAADRAGDELLPGAIAGLVMGFIAGAIVEWVLGIVFKLLLVALTILVLVLRIQACAAIREGVNQGMTEDRGQPIEAVAETRDAAASLDRLGVNLGFTTLHGFADSAPG